MAAPTLTYTLTNGNTADASEVMQNLNDLLNGYTDSSKDLSFRNGTLSGNAVLGNNSSDTIAANGYFSTGLFPVTDNSVDLGGASNFWRALYTGSYNVFKHASTPSAAAASSARLYVKSDDELYVVGNSLGETRISCAVSHQVLCDSPNGYGATNTKIRRFTNATATGTDITYADSAANGASFTIVTAGLYSMTYADGSSGGTSNVGISVNSNQLTTDITGITTAHRVAFMGNAAAANTFAACSAVVRLAALDVVRPHCDANLNRTDAFCQFRIIRIG